MCELGETVIVQIGREDAEIDSCIANIVVALNKGGVETFESCCGHGQYNGTIFLKDGRELEIMTTPKECVCWEEPCHTRE